MKSTVLPLSSHYRDAIRFTLFQQVSCALLCLLLLDFGRLARVCGITMIVYWIAVALLMLQRPLRPTSGDLAFLRWGFLMLFATAVSLAQWIY